jgi:hypothetical protein
MSFLEKFGFKPKRQKEEESEQLQTQKEIAEKQQELAAAIFQLDTFNKNLAEGGRMIPGDTGRRALMEGNISRIRKELESLKARLSNQQ